MSNDERRVQAFAAKYRADHEGTTPLPAPTDERLAATFDHCARPCPERLYDEVRAALARWDFVSWDAEHGAF
jgi:hypothetical protein